MKASATDSEWVEWVELQKLVLKTGLEQRDVSAAIEMLNHYLAERLPEDLRREALAFRATLFEEEGQLGSAKSDFLSALELAPQPDYVRFELEDSLAHISEKQGSYQEANKWFGAALDTAARDPRVAGGAFILRMLRFRSNQGFTDEEHRLIRQVIQQSWHLLRVEGDPDLEDLEGTARKLIEAQSIPFSADRPPAPTKVHPDPTA
jgi:tetratricopeptide (TPR) repeat protein